MADKYDTAVAQVHEEKQKRRAQVAYEVQKRRLVEQTVDELYDWVDDLHAEINEQKSAVKLAKKEMKSTIKSKLRIETLAKHRLSMLKELKSQLHEAKDMLADESQQREALERMQTIKLEIKCQRSVGHRGGSGKWPVHVVLLLYELLGNGTPPSAIPANIQTMSAAFTGAEATELYHLSNLYGSAALYFRLSTRLCPR